MKEYIVMAIVQETIDAFDTRNAPELIRCKDCKHFEIKDHWANFNGISILATSDCPTCNKWADGCKTKPDGYCFMAERRDLKTTIQQNGCVIKREQ